MSNPIIAPALPNALPRNIKPFVKWAGGKRALTAEVIKRMPPRETWDFYHEPFLGGGAVFFEMFNRGLVGRKTDSILSDLNKDLMRAYMIIRAEPEALIESLRTHAARHCEDYYYQVRPLNPDIMDPILAAARFIYLNRTCFNGLYRVNRKGAFNVPFGKYIEPTICDEENIRACSIALQKANVCPSPFDAPAFTQPSLKRHLYYFDPPYLPVKRASAKKDAPKVAATSFTAYDASGFDMPEHKKLAEYAKSLARRGAFVLVSNSDMPEIRALYQSDKHTEVVIDTVRAPRAINSRASERGDVNELLITIKPR